MGNSVSTVFVALATFLIIYSIFPRLRPTAAHVKVLLEPNLAKVVKMLPDKFSNLRKVERLQIGSRWIDLFFYLLFSVCLVFLVAHAWNNYAALGSWPEFLWNIDRVVLGLLRGDSLMPYLADRYNPIVVAFVPLYSVWNDPRILLLFQAAGLAVAALPLYWFARQRLGRLLALIIAGSYLFSLPVHNLNTGDIFELKFSVPLVAFALFFLLRQRDAPFLVCLGLAALVKEDLLVIALGCAAFIFLVQRKRALGLVLVASCLGLALLVTEIVYPAFHSGHPFYLWGERYAYLGNTLAQVTQSLFFHPNLALNRLLTPERIKYAAYLLQTSAWLSLLGMEVTAIMFPALAYGLLSEWPQQSDPTQYYQSPLIPVIFFGAVVGMERLLKWGRLEQGARGQVALAAAMIVGLQFYLPSTWARVFNPAYFAVSAHAALGQSLMSQIPAGSIVVSQTEFITALTGTRAYQVRQLRPDRDYRQADYLFGDENRLWYKYYQSDWGHWRASGYFDTVVEKDGYFLLKRKSSFDPSKQFDNGWALLGYSAAPNSFNRPLGFRFENGMNLLGYTAVPSDKIRSGEKLRVIVEWQADQDMAAQFIVLAHLQDARGHVWGQMDRQPIIPTPRWKLGDVIRDQYTFELPRVMSPGEYQVTLGVWDPQAEKSLTITDAQGQMRGIEVVLGTMVEKDTTEFPSSYLQIPVPYRAEMGDLTLLGVTPIPEKAQAGDHMQVGVYWQARDKPTGDYVVVFQLQDTIGNLVFEQSEPLTAGYPTSRWQPGEIALDWHDLILPSDLKPGVYSFVLTARRDHGVELGHSKIVEILVVD